jgi:integrase
VVTAVPAPGRLSGPPGLLDKLAAAVRPEFRGDDLAFDLRDPVFGGKPCLVSACERTAVGHGLCQGHRQRWAAAGRPAVREFAESTAPFAAGRAGTLVLRCERIRLGALPARLKLEVQYALQRRHDEREGKAPPFIVMIMVRFLAASGASSLLDRTEQEWREAFGRKRSNAVALLAWSRCQVADLAEGGGWDAEYPRDAWQMHRLGFAGRNVLDFSRIPQQQLRDLVKRWIRWRLSTGLGLEAGGVRPLRGLTRFAVFLREHGIDGADGISRAVLEGYLADLHAAMGGRPEHGAHVSVIGLFLSAVRQHGWAPGLPSDAMVFRGDQPPRIEMLPRALAGHVMAQVEQPGSLARQGNPAYRLATLILIRCGLRVSDALKLPFDCTVTDDAGAPYLRYLNNKMKREALVPVDDELLELIHSQQQRVLGRYPPGAVLFPRPEKNPDGKTPVSSSTYRLALYRWLELCDVCDEHGRLVRLTPHQWRHTLGTVLINRDVPQHVVQKILDHDSPLMTAHYARLSDKTVREHWEKARKVNAQGRPVQISPDGPLGEAAWSKQRLSRATQALPNGYCELPMVRTCPHANSCLTCPMFVTTAEFLPQHRAQRRQTLQIITAAEAKGQARVAEMNKQVTGNLDKIIATLEAEDEDSGKAAGDAT